MKCRALSHAEHVAASPTPEQCIELGGTRITYTLRLTPRRRAIALLIDERGLLVAAPLSTPQQAIDKLLR